MFSVNGKETIFAQEWQKFLEHKRRKKKDLPEKPSPGWLADIAASKNLCSATWKSSGEYVVCGAELWKYKSLNEWLCSGCHQTLHPVKRPEVDVTSGLGAIKEVEGGIYEKIYS